MAATQSWEDRDRHSLLVKRELMELGLFPAISGLQRHLYYIDIGAEDCAEKAKALDKLSQIEDAENIARGAAHPEQDLVEHTYVPDPNIAFGPNTAPVPEVQPQAG
ncbi:hypothetical protein Q3G72_020329 [Acer saccharum]|nr:hypothetical protein Q3G72_020329 [Acer saccharum]